MSTSFSPKPGALYITSFITNPSSLPEQTFTEWYDNTHIPEVIAHQPPVHFAQRLKNVDPAAAKPYLVYLPVDDLAALQKPASGELGERDPRRWLETEMRVYEVVQRWPESDKKSNTKTKFIASGGFELGESLKEEDLSDWYNQEHLSLLSKVPHYIRTTRFKIISHQKFPPSLSNTEETAPPTWHAMHEFSEEIDTKEMGSTIQTERAKRIFAGCTRMEYGVWKVESVSSF